MTGVSQDAFEEGGRGKWAVGRGGEGGASGMNTNRHTRMSAEWLARCGH